jgi:pyrimidine-nucleoside phosphorylase
VNFVDLIERKRDGGRLSAEEIAWLIGRYSADEVPDYQMSSMLMAVFLNGLDDDELAAWTQAMLESGDTLDFSHVDAPKVDKHSTGGVGDKVSIPLAPIVAACGVAVPMMSGRGLGHTGGTLDKLESIPGFRVQLDRSEFTTLLERHGLVLGGQSDSLVPADKRIYALRDASGTVPSIELIASSIMSKKLAEGLDALVLDVKVGSGAFMKELDDAVTLARTMVGLGESHGTDVTALITDMSQPLGNEIGNASEMRESVDVLQGGGPDDLVEIVMALGAEMLVMGGVADDPDSARQRMQDAIEDGSALHKLEEVVVAQGGEPAPLHDPSLWASAPEHHEITADRDGVVTRCDALDLGVAAMRLGAGRATKEDEIDRGVGVTVHAKVGTRVSAGDPLATLHWRTRDTLDVALPLAERGIAVGDGPIDPPTLIIRRET